MNALFRCSDCEHEYEDELPADLFHIEAWPVHCGQWASLVEVAGEGRIISLGAQSAQLPFPGHHDNTETRSA